MEAITLRKGIKIKGEGAHKELIDFTAEIKLLTEEERRFLQQMREYRNRISYEGFMVKKEYFELNQELINKIIQKIKLNA